SMAKRELLAYSSDPDALYFSGSDRGPGASEHAEATFAPAEVVAPAAPLPKPKAAETPAPVSAPVAPAPVAAPATGGQALADQPVGALESLQVMLALKLGK